MMVPACMPDLPYSLLQALGFSSREDRASCDDACMQDTEADMARSVFCACPPGATQDTTRLFKAILKGCIPVTFFRANDLPFERFLVGLLPSLCSF